MVMKQTEMGLMQNYGKNTAHVRIRVSPWSAASRESPVTAGESLLNIQCLGCLNILVTGHQMNVSAREII